MKATAFLPSFSLASFCLALLAAAGMARAAPFELAVTPSRFELAGKAGARLGQSLDIHNLASAATEVTMRTIDWSYSAEGNIGYHDELLPGSCRPWVVLERRSLSVPARSKRSFRFQVEPPADAPRGECRFMIAIEGTEPAQQTVIRNGGASLSLPVTGRIAVAVYVMLDGAEPRLEIRQIASGEAGGARRAVVTVVNTGDAHGRLEGSLDATDSQGRAFELVPEGTPILPGQTRTLALVPKGENGQPAPQPAYPVKASGRLDWDKGSFKVDVELK
ncbi:COG1470 family protein [Variovorax sp. 22077]|uniref:COG1470 family protein n=1 Tax=Variovorax TaxID=34072 RepID=UPI003F84EB3C